MNALEAAEGDGWRTFHIGEVQVQLHNLVSCPAACVRHGYIGVYRTSGIHGLLRHLEVTVFERRVAEPVSERVERLSFEVPVGPAGHRIVLEVGQLREVLVEGQRQPAGRIVLAAERLGDCSPAFLAGVPRFENGICVIVDPIDSQSAAIHQDDRDRLAGGDDCFNQSFLGCGKVDAGAISAEKSGFAYRHLFAFQRTGDAHDGNDDIGVLRRGNCLR